MSSRRNQLIGLVLMLAVAIGTWAWMSPAPDLSREYRIGTDGVFPYHDVGPTGEARGFVVEVLNEAARRRGVKLKWVRTGEKLDEALSKGTVDLWPLAGRDFIQSKKGLHASLPWLNNDFAFVALEPKFRDAKHAGEVRKVAGRGSVGVRGLAASHFRNAEFVNYGDRREAIEAMCRGEVDGAIVELRVAHYFLAVPPKSCAGKVPCFIGLTFREEQMAMAARAESGAVADLLREEMERMADDGSLDRILLPWAYYQTEEIRAIFKVSQAERRYRLVIGFSIALLVFGIGLLLQQRWLHLSKLGAQISERENLAKTQVLRWVSHELRTPLNAVVSAATLLRQKKGVGDEEEIELATMIQSSGAVLTRLVGDLLDAAQFIGDPDGGPKLETRKTDLKEMIREVGAEFRLMARHQGLQFEAEQPPVLPVVELDPLRLRQVLSNLLSNALEHTEEGVIRLRVELVEPKRLRVSVEDTGRGVAEADQERIFAEFERSGESREQRRGLGLGLPLSKSIVEKMGGRMGVVSKQGEGSKFWFEIPLQLVEGNPLEVGDVSGVRHGELRVLVVDDDRMNRVLLSRLVGGLKCQTETAENGEEAIRKLETGRFDLVLMDCWMPVMDGYQAVREIRERYGKTIRVVGCTAHCLRSDIELCFEAGMDDVLMKPVDLAKLRVIVDSVRQIEIEG